MNEALALGAKNLHSEALRGFTTAENETWNKLFSRLEANRRNMAWPGFVEGVKALGITADRVPDCGVINETLSRHTGWRGVPVNGLEDGYSFYPALARREFPIGNFIRDGASLGYTPAPDIFHDLYGHIPFYMDQQYANFCEQYGQVASRYLDKPQKLQMYERFFWFCVEFPLIETPQGRRIFGAGIISSYDESLYSLSNQPIVHPFDIKTICLQDYRIDQIQPILFLLKSTDQLYSSLADLERTINLLAKGD